MNAALRLLHSVVPTSVGLHVTVDRAHPSAAILGLERMGSGTLVDPAGIVLTVNYVALGAKSIRATLSDGSERAGEVIAQDFFSGLAAVKIERGDYACATPIGENRLTLGQDVCIVASTGGDGRRVSDGAISSLAPFDAFWEYRLESAILATAPNPGLGGAALFTSSGALAGIASLDLAEVGKLTMAIPAEHYFAHADELLRHGRRVTRSSRAWIGLYCHVLRNHVVIAGLLPGGPGAGAGLKPGDVILSVDGAGIDERGDLYAKLWKRKPGEVVHLQVFRSDRTRDVAVEAGDADEFFA